jgi:hypothetical protein
LLDHQTVRCAPGLARKPFQRVVRFRRPQRHGRWQPISVSLSPDQKAAEAAKTWASTAAPTVGRMAAT